VLWEGQRPFTLLGAVVSDDGISAGYTYSWGSPEGQEDLALAEGERASELTFTVIDAHGVARASHRFAVEVIRFVDGATLSPRVEGILLHPADGRVTLRTSTQKGDAETWYTLRLTDPGKLQQHTLCGRTDRSGRSDPILAARPVAGTPLTLVHRWRHDRERQTLGATFELLGEEMETVWSLDLPTDYQVPGDSQAESNLHDDIWRNGAILESTRPGRFAVRVAASNERILFEVRRRPRFGAQVAASNQRVDIAALRRSRKARPWEVREVSREPWLPPKRPRDGDGRIDWNREIRPGTSKPR
jgi:hypothetical protein